jgi:hypothetical protein
MCREGQALAGVDTRLVARFAGGAVAVWAVEFLESLAASSVATPVARLVAMCSSEVVLLDTIDTSREVHETEKVGRVWECHMHGRLGDRGPWTFVHHLS